MLDRLGGLIIQGSAFFPVFNENKMWSKIQHQMEALNQIYMAPNMRTLKKIKILNNDFALFCLMKRDGVNRMIPLAKRDISELDIQDMSQKIINKVLTRS